MKNNPPTRYTAPAIGLHWLLALLIIGMLAAGLIMTDLAPTPFKFSIYQWHKSIGLLILALAVARLLWRMGHPAPKLPAGPAWQHWVAHVTHIALYVSLFSMPITGWLMSDAAGYHPNFFGLPVPIITAANPEWAGFWKEIHELNSNLLIGLLVAHIGAALYHHLIKRDAILTRIVPTWLKLPRPTVPYAKQLAKVLGALVLMVLPLSAQAQVALWITNPEASSLTWQSAFNGQPVQGKFHTWETKIVFSPTDLANSHISVNVTTNSVSSADKQRDETLRSTAFFNVLNFPLATFNSTAITSATLPNGQIGYLAKGNFMLAGTTLPLEIPFTLTISGTQASASGTFVIPRLAYNIGGGEWANTKVIPDEVTINFQIEAEQQSLASLTPAAGDDESALEPALVPSRITISDTGLESIDEKIPGALPPTNDVATEPALPDPDATTSEPLAEPSIQGRPEPLADTPAAPTESSPTNPLLTNQPTVSNAPEPLIIPISTMAAPVTPTVVLGAVAASSPTKPPVNLNDIPFNPIPSSPPDAPAQ